MSEDMDIIHLPKNRNSYGTFKPTLDPSLIKLPKSSTNSAISHKVSTFSE